jgi:hypothetical protein
MSDDRYIGVPVRSIMLGTSLTAVSTGSAALDRQPEEPLEAWLRRNMREYPVTLDLPPELLNEISKIVTHWALAEWIQLGILAMLIGMKRRDARVLYGTRMGNAARKIMQLLEYRQTAVSTDLEALSKDLTACEEARNLVGHGVWMLDPETNSFCIENPSGEWREQGTKSITRRKYPQAFHPDPAWFAATLADIKAVTRSLQRLHEEIEAQLSTSPQKSE